ncbi:MAG TPA: nucleoside deaminase [Bacteroidales bacterium]|nr:nucleoside deaminase [Bacteroidales bacterium]HRZ48768.1 nucleoside deaminase [Bacteroidales bacterium]
MLYTDDYFMKEALKEAQKAFDRDEVPVGCVVVASDRIIARGHNLTETLNDVTAHAEMQAITASAHYLGGKFLTDCSVYITLEPCPMCAGALFWARPGRIVYGAEDPKNGYMKHRPSLIHPKTLITKGVLAEESAALLRSFFEKKR